MKINVTLKVPDKYCNECRYHKSSRGGDFCTLFYNIAHQGWNPKTANWDEPFVEPENYALRKDGYNLLKCKMCEESLVKGEV